MASAGPYASLHLAPDRLPCNTPQLSFLQAGCPSCCPTNSVKALKAHGKQDIEIKSFVVTHEKLTIWMQVNSSNITFLCPTTHPVACSGSMISGSVLVCLCMPSVLWRCWLGGRKGIRPVKNWVVRCWCGYLSGARCRLAHAQLMPLPLTISCFSKIQIGFTFLVPAHLGSPGQRAVKRVCVCMRKGKGC